MTVEGDSSPHSRGAERPSFPSEPPSSHREGAGKAGRRLAPMVRVQQKKHAAEPQVQPKSSGLPCAMVLRLIRDLLGERAFLPPSPARCGSIFADLAPASGRQDHATSPSAIKSFVS